MEKKGIVGFIGSILGLIGFMIPFVSIFLSITAIVLCQMQYKETKSGISLAGFIIGIIGTIINVLIIIMVLGLLWLSTYV